MNVSINNTFQYGGDPSGGDGTTGYLTSLGMMAPAGGSTSDMYAPSTATAGDPQLALNFFAAATGGTSLYGTGSAVNPFGMGQMIPGQMPTVSSSATSTITGTSDPECEQLNRDKDLIRAFVFFLLIRLFFVSFLTFIVFKFSHPLYPLLTLLFQKCELATSTPRDPAIKEEAGVPDCTAHLCSAASFDDDIKEFIRMVLALYHMLKLNAN